MSFDLNTELEKTRLIAVLAFFAFVYFKVWNRSVDRFSSVPRFWKLAFYAKPHTKFRVAGLTYLSVYDFMDFIMLFLTACAGIVYYLDFDGTTAAYYYWIWYMYIIAVFLNKFWNPLFFAFGESASYMYALFFLSTLVSFIIFVLLGVIVILFAIDGAWTSFGLLLAFPFYQFYLFVVNFQFMLVGTDYFSSEADIYYYNLEQQWTQDEMSKRSQYQNQPYAYQSMDQSMMSFPQQQSPAPGNVQYEDVSSNRYRQHHSHWNSHHN